MTGTIARLQKDKGFGFIKAEGPDDYFFHRSSLQTGEFDALREGQAVTFDPRHGPKGLRAEDVYVV